MPRTLHEQTGLTIHKNDKNQFCVVRLHYTADPVKRTPEWKSEAQAGMSDAQWAKEYEIDWSALYGEKVFPEIITRRAEIVVSPSDFPSDQAYWGGLDHGQRNPSSFHVYTIHDGITYAIWELYEPCKNIAEFSRKMRECPYFSKIKYIAADPHIWDNRSYSSKDGRMTSVYDLFVENGVYNLLKGSNDEAAWILLMRRHWSPEQEPTFKIFNTCTNMIREFEGAVYPNMSERLLSTRNYTETIQDRDNHALDDCKYFMNSRPKLQQKTFKYPIMVRKWLR